MTKYAYLRVSKEVAETLERDYGFEADKFNSMSKKSEVFGVYPNANWIHMRTECTLEDGYAPSLSVEQVLALQVLDNAAWNSFLSAEFPDVPTYHN